MNIRVAVSYGASLTSALLILLILARTTEAHLLVVNGIQCFSPSRALEEKQDFDVPDAFAEIAVRNGPCLEDMGTVVPAFSNGESLLAKVSVLLRAEPGGRLDLTSLDFEVECQAEQRLRYDVVYSIGGFGEPSQLLPVDYDISEGGLVSNCSVDLSQCELNGVDQIEFQIYAIGQPETIGLTFEEIAINGKVMKAPLPGAIMLWLVLGAASLFGVGLTASRSMGERLVISSPSAEGQALADSRLETGAKFSRIRPARPSWPEDTRLEILRVVRADNRHGADFGDG